MSLVQIPWQPTMWVHGDFLAKLKDASHRLGRNIMLGSVRDPLGNYLAAWRDDYSTHYLWNGYINHLPGFSSASDPDSGPRSHQRGVGGDLAVWPADLIAACRAAGIQVNGVPGEPWHIQLPNYLSYPIIRTNTITSGTGKTIPVAEDIERSIAMGVLKLHKVTNAAQAKFPWLVSNEITLRYVLLDQHGHDNLTAMGVDEGDPISTTTMDEIDSYRGALWPANLLPGFHG